MKQRMRKRGLIESDLAKLNESLNAISEKKEEITKLQHGKAGNVYIISNLGSFGDDVFKIGMTRRLDPQERVDELGSASVPFEFDVHSFIFSEDAAGLEAELHRRLNSKRVNKVNRRKNSSLSLWTSWKNLSMRYIHQRNSIEQCSQRNTGSRCH